MTNTQPADAQWPTIDPPAAAKTPNIDRRTLKIALAITGAAAIALIFAVVGFSGNHSSVPATTASSSSAPYVSPQEQRLVDVYNRYTGQLDPNSMIDPGLASVVVHGRNGNFSNQGLASILSDLGFPSSVYNNIATHHYITYGDYGDPNDPKACASDYQLTTGWDPEEPNYIAVSIDSRWLYGYNYAQPCR